MVKFKQKVSDTWERAKKNTLKEAFFGKSIYSSFKFRGNDRKILIRSEKQNYRKQSLKDKLYY